MAKQASGTASKSNPWVRGKQFLQEVRVEMSKVAWPSKDDLRSHTSVVLIMIFLMAAVIYVLDLASSLVVKALLYLA